MDSRTCAHTLSKKYWPEGYMMAHVMKCSGNGAVAPEPVLGHRVVVWCKIVLCVSCYKDV